MSKKTRTHLHQDSIVLGNPFRIGGETSNTMLVQARPVIVGGALLSAEVAAFGAFLQKGEKRLREHHFRDRCKVLANINAAAHLRSVSAQGLALPRCWTFPARGNLFRKLWRNYSSGCYDLEANCDKSCCQQLLAAQTLPYFLQITFLVNSSGLRSEKRFPSTQRECVWQNVHYVPADPQRSINNIPVTCGLQGRNFFLFPVQYRPPYCGL